MATCSSCHQPIIWARTEQNKGIPMNAVRTGDGRLELAQVEGGNLRLTGRQVQGRGGIMVPVVRRVRAGDGTHQSHFVTCPHADDHRRRKGKTR